MSNRLIKCRKCEKSLSLAHYSINYNTGSLYSHCDDCKTNKKKPISTPDVPSTENINVEEEVKETIKVADSSDNKQHQPRVSNVESEELKDVFRNYGFKDDRMFVASRPGEFLVTLINTKKDCFIRDNILCIFETNYESSYEKECCMSYIGVNPNHIGLIKYVVFFKICCRRR